MFLKLMLNILKIYINLHSDLPFLPFLRLERTKNNEYFLCNLYQKKNYVIHIGNSKQA